MTPPDILQRLPRLDQFSPGFHDQLNNTLCEEEYKQCVPILQGDDLMWLVDYLDEVRRRATHPSPPLKPF